MKTTPIPPPNTITNNPSQYLNHHATKYIIHKHSQPTVKQSSNHGNLIHRQQSCNYVGQQQMMMEYGTPPRSVGYSQYLGNSSGGGSHSRYSQSQPQHQQFSQQRPQNQPPKKLQTQPQTQPPTTSTAQKQHQSVIRGYQLKIKNSNQQYRRFKLQMQVKIKQLYKQKIYWYNIANGYMERQRKCMADTGSQTSHSNASNTSNGSDGFSREFGIGDFVGQSTNGNTMGRVIVYSDEQVLENQLQKLRNKIQQIQNINEGVCKQKFDVIKQIQRIRLENNNLKLKVGDFMKQVQGLYDENCKLLAMKKKIQEESQKKLKEERKRYQEQIDKMESNSRVHRITLTGSSTKTSSSVSHQRKIQSAPKTNQPPIVHRCQEHPSIHELQAVKNTAEKYKILVNTLTQQILQQKLKKLNEKYEKNYGNSYGAVTVSRGGVYPVNVISDLGSRSRRSSQVNI